MPFIRKIKNKNGQTYLAEVKNIWVDGKCVQKHVRYIGKEVDGKVVISISPKDFQVDGVKVYGPLLAIHRIAGNTGRIFKRSTEHGLRPLPGLQKRTQYACMV